MSRGARVVLVHAAALAQGLVLVAVASSSLVLTEAGITEGVYGASFLVLSAAAVGASVVSGRFDVPAPRQLLGGLALGAVAMALVAVVAAAPRALTPAVLVTAQAVVGMAFSWTVTGLNTAVAQLFPPTATHPGRTDGALSALHAVLGIGAALSPVWISTWTGAGRWAVGPLTLAALMAALALATAVTPATAATAAEAASERAGGGRPVLYAVMVVLYAISEGIFGNWAKPFLREVHGLTDAQAALGLSAFWFSVTAGRLLTTVVVRAISPRVLHRALAAGMAASFVALPVARGELAAIAGFALAGLACSSVFPLSISLATAGRPQAAARISAVLVAALMIGNGVGTFVVAPVKAFVALPTLFTAAAALPLAIVALGLIVGRRGAVSGPVPSAG